MTFYNVTIRATVTKTLSVIADTADEAYQLAHEVFTTACNGDEDYDEETLRIEEFKDGSISNN